MLNWKHAAKRYREVATELLQAFHQEQDLRLSSAVVVAAAKQYKEVATRPKTPFVKLVMGTDVETQKAQQNLFKLIDQLDKLIQTYSHLEEEKLSPENLDNTPSV